MLPWPPTRDHRDVRRSSRRRCRGKGNSRSKSLINFPSSSLLLDNLFYWCFCLRVGFGLGHGIVQAHSTNMPIWAGCYKPLSETRSGRPGKKNAWIWERGPEVCTQERGETTAPPYQQWRWGAIRRGACSCRWDGSRRRMWSEIGDRDLGRRGHHILNPKWLLQSNKFGRGLI